MDLKTKYLGLNLAHPFVAGASPLVDRLDLVRRLEDAGAAAIVMHSLFEEQIIHHQQAVEAHIERHEHSFAEATSYFPHSGDFALGPDQYLEQIRKIKEIASCPVIASLNGINEGTWVEYAKLIQQAGADALELKIYFRPVDFEETAAQIEENVLKVVRMVRQAVSIPIAAKIAPLFTSMPAFAKRLVDAGADGLVLFSRFYQPCIDVENLEAYPKLELSTPSELGLRLRGLAVLHGRLPCSLAVTGGVHTVDGAVQAIMAGADAVQMVSALLQRGPEYIKTMRHGLENWMTEHEYESVTQMKGSMSYIHCPDPAAFERGYYIKILQSYKV